MTWLFLGFLAQLEGKAYVYFSDQDPILEHLICLVDREKRQIDMAMYSFTHKKVEAALVRAAERGVRVRLILDRSSREMGERIAREGAIEVGLIVSPKKNWAPLFHHKFILFYENMDSRCWTWTGSFNISVAAEKKNFENVILVDNKDIFDKFSIYFNNIAFTISHFFVKIEGGNYTE